MSLGKSSRMDVSEFKPACDKVFHKGKQGIVKLSPNIGKSLLAGGVERLDGLITKWGFCSIGMRLVYVSLGSGLDDLCPVFYRIIHICV